MASTKYQDNRGRTVMHVAAEQVCILRAVFVCVTIIIMIGLYKGGKYYKKCSSNQCSRL